MKRTYQPNKRKQAKKHGAKRDAKFYANKKTTLCGFFTKRIK